MITDNIPKIKYQVKVTSVRKKPLDDVRGQRSEMEKHLKTTEKQQELSLVNWSPVQWIKIKEH